jgi:hypothetical protein
MKHTLLSLLCAGSFLGASAQVYVQVLTPPSLVNSYVNTYASADNEWGVADLTDPANSVNGLAVMAYDGSAADSLMCEPAVNGSEINGNIAVLYRGVCFFSQKALNAQNEGAIAVLIINNTDDMAFTMLGGDLGPQVTIPTVMISQSDGALLRDEIIAGNVTMFIGNNFAAFPYNVGMENYHILQPPSTGTSQLLATNAAELTVPLGAWVRNYGASTDNSVRLRATVTLNGSEVYNEVSSSITLASGDSAYAALPDFSQSSYNGHYAITYMAETDEDDGFPQNNTVTTSLNVGSVFTYGQVAPSTGIPTSNQSVLVVDAADFTTCIYFSNPNADRVAATGLYVSANTVAAEVLTDRLAEATAYLWTDALAGPFSLPTGQGLASLVSGEYFFQEGDAGNTVFIPFTDPILLENGDNYLFCMETYDDIVRHGWDNTTDYDQHFETYELPVSMIRSSGTWYNGFSNLGGVPSLGIQLVDANSIGIDEIGRVEITPYPNPASDVIMIPLVGQSGAATLQIFDLAGAKVAEQRVSMGGNDLLTVNVNGISNGAYVFQMNFENGQFSTFRVVVSR